MGSPGIMLLLASEKTIAVVVMNSAAVRANQVFDLSDTRAVAVLLRSEHVWTGRVRGDGKEEHWHVVVVGVDVAKLNEDLDDKEYDKA